MYHTFIQAFFTFGPPCGLSYLENFSYSFCVYFKHFKY